MPRDKAEHMKQEPDKAGVYAELLEGNDRHDFGSQDAYKILALLAYSLAFILANSVWPARTLL